jgi:uncharacterized RDD family membrane protein YckC
LVVFIVLLVPSLWSSLDARTPGKPLTFSFEFGSLATVVFAVAYFGLSTFTGRGATLGNRLLGIRVASLVESHLSLWRSVGRALGYSVSFLGPSSASSSTSDPQIGELFMTVSLRQSWPSGSSQSGDLRSRSSRLDKLQPVP